MKHLTAFFQLLPNCFKLPSPSVGWCSGDLISVQFKIHFHHRKFQIAFLGSFAWFATCKVLSVQNCADQRNPSKKEPQSFFDSHMQYEDRYDLNVVLSSCLCFSLLKYIEGWLMTKEWIKIFANLLAAACQYTLRESPKSSIF